MTSGIAQGGYRCDCTRQEYRNFKDVIREDMSSVGKPIDRDELHKAMGRAYWHLSDDRLREGGESLHPPLVGAGSRGRDGGDFPPVVCRKGQAAAACTAATGIPS
jgi:hypothetical protein